MGYKIKILIVITLHFIIDIQYIVYTVYFRNPNSGWVWLFVELVCVARYANDTYRILL